MPSLSAATKLKCQKPAFVSFFLLFGYFNFNFNFNLWYYPLLNLNLIILIIHIIIYYKYNINIFSWYYFLCIPILYQRRFIMSILLYCLKLKLYSSFYIKSTYYNSNWFKKFRSTALKQKGIITHILLLNF